MTDATREALRELLAALDAKDLERAHVAMGGARVALATTEQAPAAPPVGVDTIPVLRESLAHAAKWREWEGKQAPAALTDEQVLAMRSEFGWAKETIRRIEREVLRLIDAAPSVPEQAEQPAVAKHAVGCLWEGTAIRSASDIVNCSCVTPTAPAQPPSAQGQEALTDDQVEEVLTHARVLFRQCASGPRGQQIMPSDSLDYWIVRATERRLSGAQGGGV